MMMNNATLNDWAKKGYALTEGHKLIETKKLVDKNPKKISSLLTGNAKVKNATKVQADGLTFDSKLEYFMYGLLRDAGIDFSFQLKYVLQDKFRYNGGAIREISLTVDFILPDHNTIIDTKGMQTQQGAIRWKLLKKWLNENWRTFDPNRVLPKIEMPKNQEECRLLLNRLVFEKP